MKGQIFACEDIRFELGNKISLMGMFSSEITVRKERPILVPIKFLFRLVIGPGDTERQFNLRVQGANPEDQMTIELEVSEPEDPLKVTEIYQFIGTPTTVIPEAGFSFTAQILAGTKVISEERIMIRQSDKSEKD